MIPTERDSQGTAIFKMAPLASGEAADGKAIYYMKVHGVKTTVAAGATETLTFTIPYAKCYLQGSEIVSEVVDTVDLEVAHPVNGTVEQYGYQVNTGKDLYTRMAPYAAFLVQGLELKGTVTNHTAEAKEMGVNFILHEYREITP